MHDGKGLKAFMYVCNMGKSVEYTEDWNRVLFLRNNH